MGYIRPNTILDVDTQEGHTLSYVSISKPVIDRIVQAARETPTEIIGLLLGRLQDDTIIIEDSTTHEFSSEPHRAMLLPNSIAVIADQIMSGQLKGNIVGWYHSHTEGGLFYSETDIATQTRLQQFSSLITGLVVDSSTGEVGYFRVIPGTNQAVRLRDSNVTVFTDTNEGAPEQRPAAQPVPPTPTVEVRRRPPRATAVTRQMALSIILIALVLSIGIFTVVLYRYGSTNQTSVMITSKPVSTATVGNAVEILANVTGTARNVTLVYGTTGGPLTQAPMSSVANGRYGYVIPANQVTGNISYFIKANNPAGKQVKTTEYNFAVADFGLQPQHNAITVYRTKSKSLDLWLVPINKFGGEIQLSTTGNPSGLTLSFSKVNATPGTTVALNLAANANVPNGTYPVTIVGTYSPSQPQSIQITRQSVVTITVADFQASLTPASDLVHPGAAASFTVTLTIQTGFVDSVRVTNVTGLPAGSTYTITPPNPVVSTGAPTTTELTLQIRTVASAKTGTYLIVIMISGGGVTHSVTAQIIVR